jgi:adenosylcobinamide-GDP ribazoletransferase
VNDAFRFAFGTLTAIRVPAPNSVQRPVPGRAMALAPLAGLVLGIIAMVVAWLALRLGLSTLVVAVIVIVVLALGTRGLHLDGLADTADGLAASYDRAQALAVMRRGDTGPTGLAAVVLALLLQSAALAQVLGQARQRLPNGPGGDLRAVVVIAVIAVCARVAIPVLCAEGVPAARPQGLGATVAGSVVPTIIALVFGVTAVVAALGGVIAGYSWWVGPVAVVLAMMAAAAVTQRAVTRFGGITGDVIGAGVEVAAVVSLLVFAAA